MGNNSVINKLIQRHPSLKPVEIEIKMAAEALISCYEKGNKVLVCGNGGSSSDSDHIVGELMKGFENKRELSQTFKNKLLAVEANRGKYLSEKLQQALPAISLSAHTALITAVANDTDPNLIFAQQVIGYGKPGDVLVGISSSGNSQNVIDALLTAKAKEMTVIGLTGESGGKMKAFCDYLIPVPEKNTAFVQEFHLPIYHSLCVIIENYFFGKQKSG